jgi:hypothetical protein
MLARMTIASQRKNNGKQKNRYTYQKTVEIKQKRKERRDAKKKRLSIQHSIITTKRKKKIH